MNSKTPKTPPPPCGTLEACTGCGACAASCPQDSIAMQPDDEGFLYPVVDPHTCTDCGLCLMTCPVNPSETFTDENASNRSAAGPLSVFAAWHLDESIRRASSSGGVFTALAESILAQGGVVAGAAFDEQFVVCHTLIESAADLPRLRGSKYVQSEIPCGLYRQIQDQLKLGLPVLFSGTPCQVAGLRGFLHKAYENLFCCDLACMGVPSPLLFQKYIDWKRGQNDKPLVSYEFRNKAHGWKTPDVRLHFSGKKTILERGGQNPYSGAFGKRIALRPACYACDFKSVTRPGDLTLADFWGVAKKYPEYDRDDKGTSLVLVNTKKGKAWLDDCQSSLFLGPADLDTAVAGNPMLVRPSPRPPQRDTFYLDLKKLPVAAMVRKYRLHGPTKLRRLAAKAKQKLKTPVRWLLCQVKGETRT